jgi:hypothetical protein
MFRCQITGKLSRRGDPRTGELVHIHEMSNIDDRGSEKLHKIVVRTRQVEYKHWDREAEEEWFSYGTEIAKEVNATDEGLAIWNRMTPEQREEFCQARGW